MCVCVILLLCHCNCGCTITDEQQEQQQNYTVTTTTLRTKKSIYKHILCNFQELNGEGRLDSDINCSDVPPSRGIWWPRLVLHQITLTFTVTHKISLTFSGYSNAIEKASYSQIYPPVEASGG